MDAGNRKKDIAVIGMSGVFPKSNDLSSFWDNLVEGKELIHFYDTEDIDPSLVNDPNYIPVGSFINNSESFDYKFFGYTRAEAALMDPQIRIMHEQVYTALDNAGYANQLDGNTVGLYLSASDNLDWRLLEMFYSSGAVSKFLAQRLSNKEFISTLISYKLGLKGPSFYIDSACSASLSNVHLACRSLLLKECNIAVSGGVSIHSSEDKGYFYEKGLIASKDGHCRAFDKDSSGTTWGQGAGAVVLKRFEDAVRDKDYIYAVVKATAVNNDGKRKVGYTAPSVEGQSECIKMAHKIAGISPDSISYIEAHGTGTKLGDPIEIEALNKAFNYNTNHSCAIGSVKTNMGHLDSAAGIAGFIKACLCVDNRMIPPSLHFKVPNPEINFEKGPFYVSQELQKWESPKIFRAGVSSFGIGGTNCHAVLEEYKEPVRTELIPTHQLMVLSAKTKPALKNYKLKLASFLEEEKNTGNANVNYSINQKVQPFPFKDFIVYKNKEEASSQLMTSQDKVSSKLYRNVIFMFPGQGTQYFEMAKELYQELPAFKAIMDKGFGLLKVITNCNYKEIIGYEKVETENANLINDTLYTQPLLFLVEYALAKTLLDFGIRPSCMIGHSLGEYSAACAANMFSLEDGLKIICARANLMNLMKPGSMIAVKAEAKEVLGFFDQNELSVAAINTKGTCVLSGETEYIEKFAEKLKEYAISFRVLNTSHAFHSYMMDEMLKPFEEVLSQVQFAKPEIPIISNLTGRPLDESDLLPSYWIKHLRETVQFQKGLEYLVQKWPVDDSAFLEIGPGRTLLGFLKRKTKDAKICLSMLRAARESKSDYKSFLNTLGVLWSGGSAVDLSLLDSTDDKKTPVPSYVFDVTKLPAKVNLLKLIQPKDLANVDMNSILSNISTDTLFNEQENEKLTGGEEQSDNLRVNLTTDYVGPENEIQTKLCSIWESFLGEEQIGIDDNFFDLGGDSLKAMSILNSIKKEFACDIQLQELYEIPNIRNISLKIEISNKLRNLNKTVSRKNKLTI